MTKLHSLLDALFSPVYKGFQHRPRSPSLTGQDNVHANVQLAMWVLVFVVSCLDENEASSESMSYLAETISLVAENFLSLFLLAIRITQIL
jgi:hypothetical protein